MVMVQDEASAQFGGMPHSAIATKLVDYIVPVSEMPARLLDYSRAVESRRASPLARVEPGAEALQQLLALILARSANDFSHYKPATIVRRVERRMAVHRVDGLPDYVRYVQENPAELDLLFHELLIGVTSFFRDREAWQALESCVTNMMRDKPDDYVVRAWVTACSTGEEAYSLAILLRECMASLGRSLDVQIFATDIDSEAIDIARVGAFPAGITNDVSPNRLGRFFVLEGTGYRARLRAAKPHFGPAVHEVGYLVVPKSPHLSRCHAPEAYLSDLSLCSQARWAPLSRVVRVAARQ
jgi:two-component system CheB/CheR fusion protein